MIRSRVSTCCLGLTLLVCSGVARTDGDVPAMKRTNVSKGIYMLRDVSGNTAVLTGKDGVLLIDGKLPGVVPELKRQIQRLTTQPIRFVINTHWHQDHTGNNEQLVAEGAQIIAQHNTRKRMSEEQYLEVFNRRVPPSSAGALPAQTFGDDMYLHINGQELHLFHAPAAHTDGDCVVHFTQANVIHTGDVFSNGRYPYIDTSAGGSIDGMIAAVDRILELADDETKLIPGHGELAGREDLVAYREMLSAVRQRVTELIEAGKGLDEIQAAEPTAEFDAHWRRGSLTEDLFLDVVYTSLIE